MPKREYTEHELKTIHETMCPAATQAQFDALMCVANAHELDPLLRQIHFVPRRRDGGTTWNATVSIDGLRVLAQRSGVYGGQDEPIWTYDDKGKLEACKVGVHRKDWTRPCVAVAFWSESAQQGGLWATKARLMLAKVAEASALRRAFPESTAGLYSADELPSEPDPSPRYTPDQTVRGTYTPTVDRTAATRHDVSAPAPDPEAEHEPVYLSPKSAEVAGDTAVPEVIVEGVRELGEPFTLGNAASVWNDCLPHLTSIEDKSVAFAHLADTARVSKALLNRQIAIDKAERGIDAAKNEDDLRVVYRLIQGEVADYPTLWGKVPGKEALAHIAAKCAWKKAAMIAAGTVEANNAENV